MDQHLAPDQVVAPLPPDEGAGNVAAPLPLDQGADASPTPERRPTEKPDRPGRLTLDDDIIAERDPHATPPA